MEHIVYFVGFTLIISCICASSSATSTVTSTTTTAGCVEDAFDKCTSISQSDCCVIDSNTMGYTYSNWCPTTCCGAKCFLPNGAKVVTVGFVDETFLGYNQLYCIADLMDTCEDMTDCCDDIPFWETKWHKMCPKTCCRTICPNIITSTSIAPTCPLDDEVTTNVESTDTSTVDPSTYLLNIYGKCVACIHNIDLPCVGVIEFDDYIGDITSFTFPASVHTLIFNTLVGNIYTSNLNNISTVIITTQFTGNIYNYSTDTTSLRFFVSCSSTHLGPDIHVGDCNCEINDCNLVDLPSLTIFMVIIYISVLLFFCTCLWALTLMYTVRYYHTESSDEPTHPSHVPKDHTPVVRKEQPQPQQFILEYILS